MSRADEQRRLDEHRVAETDWRGQVQRVGARGLRIVLFYVIVGMIILLGMLGGLGVHVWKQHHPSYGNIGNPSDYPTVVTH